MYSVTIVLLAFNCHKRMCVFFLFVFFAFSKRYNHSFSCLPLNVSFLQIYIKTVTHGWSLKSFFPFYFR